MVDTPLTSPVNQSNMFHPTGERRPDPPVPHQVEKGAGLVTGRRISEDLQTGEACLDRAGLTSAEVEPPSG